MECTQNLANLINTGPSRARYFSVLPIIGFSQGSRAVGKAVKFRRPAYTFIPTELNGYTRKTISDYKASGVSHSQRLMRRVFGWINSVTDHAIKPTGGTGAHLNYQLSNSRLRHSRARDLSQE